MKKLICTKLLTFMCLNLLITPLLYGGKKFQRGKNNGYAKQHNKFHSRKNVTQKTTTKEKRRKSRNHIFSESLSQTNKERNALLKEILHKKEATRKKNILYSKKKYRKQTINIDPAPRSCNLNMRGINLSPWLIPAIILGFFAQTANASIKCYEGNFDGILYPFSGESTYPLWLQSSLPATSFCRICNDGTGYLDEIFIPLSKDWESACTNKDMSYSIDPSWAPFNQITIKRPCECEEDPPYGTIHCRAISYGNYKIDDSYLASSSTPSTLEITSQIAQIITPAGIFLGFAAIPTILCCLLNKKVREKIKKCTKKLSKKSTVTIEDITDEPDPLVSTEIHNETDTKSSATASNIENDYNTSSSETNSETDDPTSIEEDSSTETE